MVKLDTHDCMYVYLDHFMYMCVYVILYMYIYSQIDLVYTHVILVYFCIYIYTMRFARSEVNNPDWNFEFVSDSNVLEYVSPEMLPAAYWTWGKPANKKDACFDDLWIARDAR